MKKTQLQLLFALLLLANVQAFAQCTFTAGITVSGLPTGCGDRTLTASATGNTWTSRAAFTGTAREYATAFSIGSKGYVGTGYNGSVSPYYYYDLWEFDPSTNSWSQKANFPGTGRYGAVGFGIGSKGYIGTGCNPNVYPYYYQDFYEYDPSTNYWSAKASFPGTGRYFAAAFNVGTKGYIGTGMYSSSSYFNDFYEYDPSTNFWTQKAGFSGTARSRAVGLSIGTKGYIGTGYNGNYFNDFYQYDPSTNSWATKASVAYVYGAVAWGIGNYGFITTGNEQSTSAYSDKIWKYDQGANTWTQGTSIGSGNGRNFAAGFAIGSRGYVCTGYDGSSYLNTTWEYEAIGSYSWSTGAVTQTILATGSNNYSVLVTTASGCTATASQSVALSPNPVISVSGGTTVACAGTGNTLIASGAGSYVWSSNAGSATSNSVVVTPTIPTTYTVSGTTGSCTVDYEVPLSVNIAPVATIGLSGPASGCGTLNLTTNSGGDTWTQKLGLNTGREYAVAFSIGNKGYVGTGYNGNVSPYYFSDLWEYDPGTNAWTQKANFGGGVRYGAAAFSIGSKGYVGTGYYSSLYNDFWEYDPSTNTWTQKSNFPSYARNYAIGFGIGSKGYMGMGTGNSSPYTYNDLWEYNPSTNTWTQKASVTQARYAAAGFSIGNKGYVGCGIYNSSLNDFWEYDPSGNTWTSKANYPGGYVEGIVGFGLSSKGYMGTGYTSGIGVTSFFYEYNPATNAWTQKSAFGGAAREYGVAFAIGNVGYMGLGYGSSYLNDIWEYDPSNIISWSTGAATSSITVATTGTYSVTITNGAGCTASSSQTVALSPNPTITVSGASLSCAGVSNTLVASGASSYAWSSNAGSGTASSVIVTPTVATTYTVSGTTGTCTVDYPVALNVNPVPSASIALSGPASGCGTLNLDIGSSGNTWTQKAGLNVGRAYGVAFSIGNKGYMGLGYNGNTSPYYYNDLWEYDPTTNAWTQKASMTTARYGAVGFSIGSKGYVGTGYNPNTSPSLFNDFWEYDPGTNTWTQKAAFSGYARAYAAGFSIGSKGYIGTGEGNNSPYNYSDLWEYNPSTNSWAQKSSLSTGRYMAVGFSTSTKGYIGTGYNGSYLSDFYEYDPSLNSWTTKTSFGGGAVRGAAGFAIGNKCYVGTGDLSLSGMSNVFYEFNPATNTWTQKTAFGGTTREYGCAFAIGGTGYLGMGYTSNSLTYLNDIWQYDPSNTIAWSTGAITPTINVAATGSYSVTISNAAGCTASSTQTVALSPNPTITVSGGSLSCAGTSNTLVASGASSYTWSSNAGSGTSSSVIVTPTAVTVYTVSGTTGTCTVDYPVSLNVNASPVATIAASGPTLGCGTLVLSTSSGGNTWTQKAGLNVGRQYPVGFSIGNKGYVGTGYNNNVTGYFNDLWEYDPASNSWSQKANFTGAPRYLAVGFSIGNKGYIGTGEGSSYYNDFYEYDPATNAWTQKANFGGGYRYGAAGFSIGSKGYIGTGYYSGYYNDFWEYDPSTNTWTQKASMSSYRYLGASLSIGNKGYIGTGYYGGDLNDFWEYNPASNSWASKASFPAGYSEGVSAFSIGSKGYMGTGYLSATGYTNLFYEYDPSLNTWTQKASFGGIPRAYGAGFSIGNKGYLGLGYTNNSSPYFMNDIWEYDPSATIAWSTGSATPSITVAATGLYSVNITNAAGCSASASQSVALSPNPTITVSGGTNTACGGVNSTLTASGATTYTWSSNAGSGTSNSVIVTPTAATVYTVSGTTGSCTVNYPISMNVVPSPSSNIITVGSPTICGTSITLSTSATPTNVWTQKLGLNVGRQYAVAFSIGSKGYLGTGYNANVSPYYFNDLWEYDPATNAWTQKAGLNTGRYGAVGFSIGSKGYIGTGYNGNVYPYYMNDFWEYDPSANTWTQKANVSSVRRQAVGFSIGSKGYLGTGYDGSYKNDFYEYDPATDVWTAKASMSTSRTLAVGLSIGSKGYIGTGYVSGYGYYYDFWEYDPGTNFWTQKANMSSTGRYGAGAFSLGNKGYVGGGTTTNDFWEYNPALNSWTQKANFAGTYRYGLAAFSLGAKGYMGTGAVSTYYNDLWEYDPGSTIVWSNSSVQQSITATTSGNYSLTVTNIFGCTNTSSQAISITPVPTIAISGPNSICNGSSITLTVSGASNYTWSPNVGSATTSVVSDSPASNISYVVNAATNGCTATATKPVIVYSTPVVTANSSTTSVCQGASVTLYGSGANTYSWSPAINNNAPFPPSTTTEYTVTGADVNNCTNTAVVTVTVKPSPTVSVNGGSICQGQSFSLSPSGGLTYTYSGGSAVVSPNTTTSYSVTGFNAIGCPNAIPAVATVTVNAAPVISANSTVICIGSSYTLSPTGAASYTYSSGSNVVSPSSTTSYSITGTSTAGCLSTSPTVVTLTVSALPVVSVNSGTVCNGQNYTLAPGGASNYTFVGGPSVITGSAAVVSPVTNTTYSVTGSNIYGCISAASAISNVTVLVSPTVSVNSGTICAGQPFTLTPSGGVNYTYSGGSAVVSPTTTTSYTVTGFNNIGCPNAAPAVSTITVSPAPNIIANSGFVCEGNSYTITPGGAASYTFSSGSPVVTPSTTASYSVTGTSTAGCVSLAPAIVVVNVGAVPVISVNSGSICSGQSFTFTPSGATTYSYSGGGSNVVSPGVTTTYSITGSNANGCASAPVVSQVTVAATPTIGLPATVVICTGNSYTITPSGAASYTYSSGSNVVTPSGSGASYTVGGLSAQGCHAENVVITVSVQPNLVVSISGPNSTCLGHSITLTGNGAGTYTWSTGAVDYSIVVTPTANTTYSVSAGSANCAGSAQYVVSVNPSPTLSTVSSNTMICLGEVASLSASGANTYTWNDGSTTPMITITPTVSADYTVTGAGSNGCTSTATITQYVFDCTGISSAGSISSHINVYPNPNNGMVNVESDAFPEHATVELYNYAGQLIARQPVEGNSLQLDFKNAVNGMYTLRVIAANKVVYVSKLIKE